MVGLNGRGGGGGVVESSGEFLVSVMISDSCHNRVIRNQQYLYPKFPPTTVVKLLQYSGSRVEHRDGFSSYK